MNDPKSDRAWRIPVTGSAGYLGAALVHRLRNAGPHVASHSATSEAVNVTGTRHTCAPGHGARP